MNDHKYSQGKKLSAVFLLSLPVLLISCSGKEGGANETGGGTPVQIARPALMTMDDDLTLNGNTIFLKKEIIRSTFDGFIEKVFKNIGDKVNAGDMVIRLKTKELAASDSIDFNIGKQLFKGAVYINAGSAGVLTELDFHEGDYVTSGEQIAIISNPSSLRIRLNVPYEDVMKAKIGGTCNVNFPDGVDIPGIVEKSVPSVDLSTQTQAFLITLDRFENIPENLNVIVTIPFERFRNATVVPKSAVMTNVTQDSFWIMKLINDSMSVRVNVEKGIENDSVVQILRPHLETSDRILSSGAYGLPDTAEVEIVK